MNSSTVVSLERESFALSLRYSKVGKRVPIFKSAAFVIEAKGKRIYFAGDTDFIDEMKDLKDIDYALLPIDGKYTMDPKEALDAVGSFIPKNVVPMHWREQSPEDFKKNVEKTHSGVKVLIPKPSVDMEL